MELKDLVTSLKGIGDKTAEHLARIGIRTIEDLVGHFPRNYEHYELPRPIGETLDGELVSIECTLITSPKMVPTKRLRLLVCDGKDYSGTIQLKWYNQPYLRTRLPMATHLIFRGKMSVERGKHVMVQPEIFEKESYRPMLKSLRPVYALTEGLSSNQLAKAIRQALAALSFEDRIPARIRKEEGLMRLADAYENIHFPKDEEVTKTAIRRLAFDEFFFFLISMKMCREVTVKEENHHPIAMHLRADSLEQSLPYTLTKAQEAALSQIYADLAGKCPMNRLLQGDVGSGKTIVSLLALLACVENGYQGCLMAPTEVLARQHYEEFERILRPLHVSVEILVGSQTASIKKEVRKRTEEGQVDILIGTHALVQDSVKFQNLGFAVVDEQHRFGVKQREQLSSKGQAPHLLIMSATPIPRTLAMMLYGDMDLTLLDELPKNRLAIKTCVVDTSYRPKAYAFIREHVAKGEQAYVICPMVAESEAVEAENVTDYEKKLATELGTGITVAGLHGKMSGAKKNELMERFSRGEIDVLVSTTVIEVGINVPNATIMMIENAERFGLSGLHQLRGRVGRGAKQSYCILVEGRETEEAKERLSVLLKATDGFMVAEEDLRLRGPGDFFGIRQSGEMNFAVADIYRDAEVLSMAKRWAENLNDSEYEKLCAELVAKHPITVVY